MTREELFYNKEKLLANGDRWEPILASGWSSTSPIVEGRPRRRCAESWLDGRFVLEQQPNA